MGNSYSCIDLEKVIYVSAWTDADQVCECTSYLITAILRVWNQIDLRYKWVEETDPNDEVNDCLWMRRLEGPHNDVEDIERRKVAMDDSVQGDGR